MSAQPCFISLLACRGGDDALGDVSRCNPLFALAEDGEDKV
jgi:hypothetical protein